MTDWTPVFSRLGYKSETEMWEDLYIAQGMSITELAKSLGVSRNKIRASLTNCGVPFRGRGGPNHQKLEVTDELIEEIKKDGIAAVAKRLRLSYTTVYKRVYQVKGIGADPPHDSEVA